MSKGLADILMPDCLRRKARRRFSVCNQTATNTENESGGAYWARHLDSPRIGRHPEYGEECIKATNWLNACQTKTSPKNEEGFALRVGERFGNYRPQISTRAWSRLRSVSPIMPISTTQRLPPRRSIQRVELPFEIRSRTFKLSRTPFA